MLDDLTFSFKNQLVNALLEYKSITEKDIRTSIVEHLPHKIKNSIDRHSSNRVDTINIVKECLVFPNGIEKLIEITRMYEGNTDLLRKVYDIITLKLCLDSPISNKYLLDLLFIFDNIIVQFEKVQEYYLTSLPSYHNIHSHPKSTWLVIVFLSNFPIQEDKTQPVVHFVKSIADHLPPSKQSTQLYEWIGRVASEYGLVSEKDITTSVVCGHENNSSPVYLLVHMIPDINNRNNVLQECAVRIYAWRSPDDVPCVYENNKCGKDEIVHNIEKVMNDRKKFKVDEDIRAIEFILPSEWIDLDVNEWERNDKNELEPRFINDYQVVVRLDRSKKREHFVRWKKKWNRFIAMNGNDCAKTSISWMCNHENYDFIELFRELNDDDDKTCLMQTFLPQNPDKFGLAILEAGIPIAIWCKKYGHLKNDHEIIKNYFLEFIKDGNLLMLPDQVHKVCKKPEKKKCLQDHLTLLWDDPGRLPKKLQ